MDPMLMYSFYVIPKLQKSQKEVTDVVLNVFGIKQVKTTSVTCVNSKV